LVGQSLISTGSPTHPTPVGTFKIFFKNPDHKSSVYGWIYDADGAVINKNADIRIDKVPPGGRFDNSKMTWYNQFYPAIGMHAGYLPGYPASHGCVRMPEWMARHFFEAAPLGTPVEVVR
jgi:lipoprotein-anchoring transpeptidase ErfK/SrfK